MNFQYGFIALMFFFAVHSTSAQRGSIRGNLFATETVEPIAFATIEVSPGDYQIITDIDGFFSLSLPEGTYKLTFRYLGFADQNLDVELNPGDVLYFKVEMTPEIYDLTTVEISAEMAARKAETNLSRYRIGSRSISRLPGLSIGGDVAQYLSLLPGVISSGEQGGQLFINGGSNHQNLTLIDGILTIQPFHSLNGFSIVPTDMLRSADLHGAAFNSTYGGRTSSLLDMRLRNVVPNSWSGQISLDPFAGQALLEGPIFRSDTKPDQGLGIFISGKQSVIDQAAPKFYNWVEDGVPFVFQDLVLKVVATSSNGNHASITGILAADQIDLGDSEQYEWNLNGAGFNFRLLPASSSIVISGQVSYSSFESRLQTRAPRRSRFDHFRGKLQMDYYGRQSQLTYGFQLEGAQTDFEFLNFAEITFSQQDNTSDIAGFVNYKRNLGDLIVEGGARLVYYASLGSLSFEPRVGTKYSLADRFRIKAGSGIYTQNFVLARKDEDVVNFFSAFLSSPEGSLEQLDGTDLRQNLQKSMHFLIGAEIDLSDRWTLDVELFNKSFMPLIELNRDKIASDDPDFTVEDGQSLGLNLSTQYQDNHWLFYTSYSWLNAERTNLFQTYPAHFDRRHQVNTMAHYRTKNHWSFSIRWSLGSGFPFTRTQGFYDRISFEQGIAEDLILSNGELGILFEEALNQGRLPYYHRLDISVNKRWRIREIATFEAGLSLINVYDRANIFFFDRIRYKRIDQFPFIPSLGIKLTF